MILTHSHNVTTNQISRLLINNFHALTLFNDMLICVGQILKNYDYGFSGCGKSWTIEYCVLYKISQQLFCLTLSMMERWSVLLVGKNIHHIFLSTIDKGLSPYNINDIAITEQLQKQERLNFLQVLEIRCLIILGKYQLK